MGAGAVGMTIAKACACCGQLRSDERSVVPDTGPVAGDSLTGRHG
jgi:hypothetical protein